MVIQTAANAARIEFLYDYFMSARGRPRRKCLKHANKRSSHKLLEVFFFSKE